jgi:hypothetical protein
MKNQSNNLALMARDQEPCSNVCVGTVEQVALRTSKSSHETANNYVGLITQLGTKHRLIICKDAIQWIIQVKRGQRCGRARWVGKSYLTTPNAVINACHALCGPLRGNLLNKLRALPSNPEVPQ